LLLLDLQDMDDAGELFIGGFQVVAFNGGLRELLP
jgi:hypothetical protein